MDHENLNVELVGARLNSNSLKDIVMEKDIKSVRVKRECKAVKTVHIKENKSESELERIFSNLRDGQKFR